MNFDGRATCPVNKSYLSWSVLGFYAPLVTAGLVLLMTSLCN